MKRINLAFASRLVLRRVAVCRRPSTRLNMATAVRAQYAALVAERAGVVLLGVRHIWTLGHASGGRSSYLAPMSTGWYRPVEIRCSLIPAIGLGNVYAAARHG
jgi:hypothetical protein